MLVSQAWNAHVLFQIKLQSKKDGVGEDRTSTIECNLLIPGGMPDPTAGMVGMSGAAAVVLGGGLERIPRNAIRLN